MNTEPDLNFDIDALFDHLINDLGHESADVLNWVFTFRSTDLQALADVESDLSEEFATQLQEEVEEVNEDGERSAGDPMLMVITEAALSSQEVIKLAKRMQGIATAKNLRYEGVQCFDPIDDEDLFGWLDVEEAVWRLRHFTDAGLETNGELPWAFLLLTQTPDQTRQLAAELSEMGMDDIDLYDEPNDEGDLGLCLYLEGKNNEASLREMCEKLDTIAKKHGGHLEGVQFFTRDQLSDLYEEDGLSEEEVVDE